MPAQLGFGLLISSTIGWAAYRRAALSRSGVAGAILTGTLIYGCGGWVWGTLLITFFVLSTLISKYRERTKEQLAEKFAKGSRRDLGQALANGGAGTIFAVAHAFAPHPLLFAAFVGAIATVNADTWATELGVLNRRPPRLITTGRPVEPGTSGGISLLGTTATLVGALAIGAAALLYALIDGRFGGEGLAVAGIAAPARSGWLLTVAALGGLAGSLCDSLLGATVQAIYYSPSRQKETERAVDPNGTPNRPVRGWQWLDNDWVNFISSLVGAGVSALVWQLGGF